MCCTGEPAARSSFFTPPLMCCRSSSPGVMHTGTSADASEVEARCTGEPHAPPSAVTPTLMRLASSCQLGSLAPQLISIAKKELQLNAIFCSHSDAPQTPTCKCNAIRKHEVSDWLQRCTKKTVSAL